MWVCPTTVSQNRKVDTFIYIIGHRVVYSFLGKGEVSNKYCVLWWLVVGSFWPLDSLIDQVFQPASWPLIPSPFTLLTRLFKALAVKQTKQWRKTINFSWRLVVFRAGQVRLSSEVPGLNTHVLFSFGGETQKQTFLYSLTISPENPGVFSSILRENTPFGRK